jgi:hypothetical protein
MTSEEDDKPGQATPVVPPPRRRPAPTIEGTATEIASQPRESADFGARLEAAAAASTFAQQPEPSDAGGPSTDGASGAPPSEPPAASRFTWPAWPPGSVPWPLPRPLVDGLAIGSALVLLLIAVLWLAGALSPRDNGYTAINARLASVEARLREISNAPAAVTIDPKKLDDVSSRLAKLEAAASRPGSDGAMASRLASVEEAVKSFQGQISDLNRRADDNATAVREARGRADAAVIAAAPERTDIDNLTGRMAALEQATKAVADDFAKRPAGDRPLRLVVAAQALRAAVERGDPFAAELAAVKPLASDPQTLTPLEPFAAAGVPTPATLGRELSDLAPAMQRLAGTPPPEAGFLDRLRANAERLVRIQRVDDQGGDEPAAVIARTDAKAKRGDIEGARGELAKLPAPIRAPAEDWMKKAETRNAVVALSRRVASDALAALGKPAQ